MKYIFCVTMTGMILLLDFVSNARESSVLALAQREMILVVYLFMNNSLRNIKNRAINFLAHDEEYRMQKRCIMNKKLFALIVLFGGICISFAAGILGVLCQLTDQVFQIVVNL